MPLNYYEFFGSRPRSKRSTVTVTSGNCPLTGLRCHKNFRGYPWPSGSCSLISPEPGSKPVITCPKRFYAEEYKTFSDVTRLAYGKNAPPLILDGQALPDGEFIIPLGQDQIHEIRIPYIQGKPHSKFSVDWILAKCSPSGELIDFVALEIQTIDTTGNYQNSYRALLEEHHPGLALKLTKTRAPKPKSNTASYNWENVNKRILPQIISKGHVLRREEKCTRGLYFMIPIQVMERIFDRVGILPDYPIQTGTVTFMGYALHKSELVLEQHLTTTIDQLAHAFSSPRNLPSSGVYEEKISEALSIRFNRKP